MVVDLGMCKMMENYRTMTLNFGYVCPSHAFSTGSAPDVKVKEGSRHRAVVS
jgi:hypothetical protein